MFAEFTKVPKHDIKEDGHALNVEIPFLIIQKR